MREVDIKINNIVVESKTRTLRASLKRELVQDINSFCNIDTLDELERILGTEIRREIRRKKIDKIFKHTT
jgi:hypothetical protein